ncbi:helix-turn-helix domain-containing protein [Achromobacter ruhlandii]|uniref:helix-turn-helix domain-containing protein n=1 Tax=Achromobacter ruhlandii TaxID=72557 RepID=UPI0009EE8D23|nr:helix-turn-helix transcriptional regulator [Achromobacter ruhlandii]
MAAKLSLAAALRTVRKARGLSQEAFSDVSSRTYLSVLERDLKSPTLNKLADICEVLNVHPVTLLVLAYSEGSTESEQTIVSRVLDELRQLRGSPTT